MARPGKVAAFAAALVLSSNIAGHALTPLDTLGDWTCSSYSERLVLTRTFALIAGRGRIETGTRFFMQCLDDAATGSSSQLSKSINEVAVGCILMESFVFSESG